MIKEELDFVRRGDEIAAATISIPVKRTRT